MSVKRSPTQTELDYPASKRTVASRDEPEQNPPDLTNDDYTVGWICALAIELAASQAMLDEIHPDLPLEPGDSNIYTLGRMGQHNIAMVCLPEGTTGTNAAATAANDLLRSYRKVRFGLMVGVGGGAPSLPNDDPFKDVRLGDVVVSTPQGSHGGVIQYDFGKTVAQGNFIQTGSLNKPPSVLLAGVAKLKANYMRGSQKLGSYMTTMLEMYPSMETGFVYPGKDCDQLFEADYSHVDMRSKCDKCDQTRTLERESRMTDGAAIHYGLIGSANQVMRHGSTREKLRRQHEVLCFEMEAAGLMENFPCIVIRGICDYSDSHKNKRWQGYAAVTAAGYAKELLSYIPSDTVKSTTDAAKIMNMGPSN
ncbi:uncharacterized protein LDX57_001364 [Aspergillus melleus]|uniref:uncharacterized protein n=1 Tax=Aspergillus melleus TaxID=138277 RepID=UPI001E8DCF74|nr:uncharacterized protein LDX57_001364 [Aspergillus melleus]KAH8423604.1 hypothetical protein LDX57_001364 [Aspergillus melleus]